MRSLIRAHIAHYKALRAQRAANLKLDYELMRARAINAEAQALRSHELTREMHNLYRGLVESLPDDDIRKEMLVEATQELSLHLLRIEYAHGWREP